MAETKELTFWEHLEELRWHLIRAVLVLIVLAIITFAFKEFIFNNIILAPKDNSFITNRFFCNILKLETFCNPENNLEVINVNMAGQFMTHIYISLMAALILGAPYIIWEIWRFIKPALKKNEKRNGSITVFFGSLTFYFGILFCYFVIVPFTINFLGSYQVSDNIANMINLNSYISTLMNLILALGLAFELPVIIYFLSKLGIVTPALMKKYRKVMVIVILALSAVITPPDIFSMIAVAIPLYGLYEVSILISTKANKKREESLEEV
ncbi:MAG: twin-arginine translocase subunit TatC [Bacteroidales bacterium]|jgi:sec-independent protein translocase protein TatC|nr:twin-arginine translocase subunit TatC [Bacteroidales bacterium]